MAYLNDLYIFVEEESRSCDVELSTHPVESGADIADHMKYGAEQITLRGKVSGNDRHFITRIKVMRQIGTLIHFKGISDLKDMLITSFSTAKTNGEHTYTMTLTQVRIAKSAYTPPPTSSSVNIAATQSSGTQQVQNNSDSSKVYHTTKSGDTVWALVAAADAPYKQYGFSCDDVMKNNPHAFSRSGDFGTLQNGVKLWVGNR